jgi:hypothetical protein
MIGHGILTFLVLFLFASTVLAANLDPKRAVVGVWTMGFCQAESLPGYDPNPIPFSCTTQLVNFHENGSVWSSYMFDQNPGFMGGVSVGATGTWYYLGDNRFFVTMLRFVNDHTTTATAGQVKLLLRTDFTVEAQPGSDEAVTGKMMFMKYNAEAAVQGDTQYLPYPVVKMDPYEDPPNASSPGPTGIPMKRFPSSVPQSPVLPF